MKKPSAFGRNLFLPYDGYWGAQLVAAIAFVNGLFAILEVTFKRFPARFEELLPVNFEYYGRFFGLFAGFLLIYFSSRLLRRKRLAWYIATIATAVVLYSHALYVHDISALILPGISFVVLLAYRRQFNVRSETTSLRQGLRLLAISLAIALAYGTLGFFMLLPRDFRPAHKISLPESGVRTVREYTLIGNDDLHPRTREARWFIDSLDWLGTLSISFAFFSLFRPLAYRYRTLPHDREQARAILERYGNSSEDAFKLWPEDKAYFFLSGGESFVAYRVERGVAMVLGEPVGPVAQWPELIRHFREYCRAHDWDIAFVYVPRTHLDAFEAMGLRPLKIGQDAIINIPSFQEAVARNKHFRAVRNKFNRLGYTFDVATPPHAPHILRATAEVSSSWLHEAERSERGYALGYYDRAYLNRCQLYILNDKAGKMVAFANAVTSYNPAEATIDLMRYRQNSETGTMDFLLLSIIEWLASHTTTQTFSLGFSPLANVGTDSTASTEEYLAKYLGRLGMGDYSFEGIRRFKSKFEPEWHDRYLMFERGPAGLTRAALAIDKTMQGRPNN